MIGKTEARRRGSTLLAAIAVVGVFGAMAACSDDDDIIMGETMQPSQGQKQALPEPELLFWFAARGDYELPPNVELEKDAARRARLTGGAMQKM